ncbi:hypothetical protein Tco_0542715 [Tanacetum coccineum]
MKSTICIVKNPVFHSKTKHIEIRHHFIRDLNENKLIQMIKIHTDQNVADLLTKAFDVGKFQYLIHVLECLTSEIQALVDGKKVIVTETSVRIALQLKDAEEPITDEVANAEHVPTHSNDPLFSGEDRLQLKKLLELCTRLSERVLDLENTKTSQAAEITKLNERVKKLERRNKSRTPRLKRTYSYGSIHGYDTFPNKRDKVNDASILNVAIAVVSTAWFKGKS